MAECKTTIEGVIATLNSIALRVDQFEETIRLKACINKLQEVLERAEQTKAEGEPVNGEG